MGRVVPPRVQPVQAGFNAYEEKPERIQGAADAVSQVVTMTSDQAWCRPNFPPAAWRSAVDRVLDVHELD